MEKKSKHILDYFNTTAEQKVTYYKCTYMLSVTDEYTYHSVHSNIAKLYVFIIY